MQKLIVYLAITLTACSSDGPTLPETGAATIGKIYWSDGDSGRLDGMAFRLANVDAPETGAVNANSGGAKCEKERERGYLAKEFIVSLTGTASISITKSNGPDRYDREVVELSADGIDVAKAGIEAGHLKPWPHENGRALSAKPDWCG